MASYSDYKQRFERHARGSQASSCSTPRCPRPASVEDFEGSDVEFAPRVVDTRPAKAEALPSEPDKRSSWGARPLTPPGYDAEPSLRCGRSSTRDSFHSSGRFGDRPITPSSRSETPTTTSSVRGILKTGRDRRTSFETSSTRSQGRVRFPNEPTGSFRRSGLSDSPERTQRSGRSPSANSERSSTGAVVDDAEYHRPLSGSSHHARAHRRDSHDHDYLHTPDYRFSVNYTSSRPTRVHSRAARPSSGEYQRGPFEPLEPLAPFEEPMAHYGSWQTPYHPARRGPAPAPYGGAHEFQPQSMQYRTVPPMYMEPPRPRSNSGPYETRRPVFLDRPRPNSSPDLSSTGQLYGDWRGTYYF